MVPFQFTNILFVHIVFFFPLFQSLSLSIYVSIYLSCILIFSSKIRARSKKKSKNNGILRCCLWGKSHLLSFGSLGRWWWLGNLSFQLKTHQVDLFHKLLYVYEYLFEGTFHRFAFTLYAYIFAFIHLRVSFTFFTIILFFILWGWLLFFLFFMFFLWWFELFQLFKYKYTKWCGLLYWDKRYPPL